MSKRELIDRELDRLPEQDLDRLLTFVQSRCGPQFPILRSQSDEASARLSARDVAGRRRDFRPAVGSLGEPDISWLSNT
jgi:hypothetical protein